MYILNVILSELLIMGAFTNNVQMLCIMRISLLLYLTSNKN